MPKPKARLTPRKQPRQARSRDTVDAILQASAYILKKRGFDAMTTNEVAERAGVNIASLYQYFPNKQAILAALMQRHVEDARAALAATLERTAPFGSAARGVRAMIEATAAAHAVDPELHEIFTVWGPKLGFEAVHTATDAALAEASRTWVESMRGRIPDPELAQWVARTAIHAVFHVAFLERKDVAYSSRLVDELVRLIAPYLDPDEPVAAGAARGPKRR